MFPQITPAALNDQHQPFLSCHVPDATVQSTALHILASAICAHTRVYIYTVLCTNRMYCFPHACAMFYVTLEMIVMRGY